MPAVVCGGTAIQASCVDKTVSLDSSTVLEFKLDMAGSGDNFDPLPTLEWLQDGAVGRCDLWKKENMVDACVGNQDTMNEWRVENGRAEEVIDPFACYKRCVKSRTDFYGYFIRKTRGSEDVAVTFVACEAGVYSLRGGGVGIISHLDHSVKNPFGSAEDICDASKVHIGGGGFGGSGTNSTFILKKDEARTFVFERDIDAAAAGRDSMLTLKVEYLQASW